LKNRVFTSNLSQAPLNGNTRYWSPLLLFEPCEACMVLGQVDVTLGVSVDEAHGESVERGEFAIA